MSLLLDANHDFCRWEISLSLLRALQKVFIPLVHIHIRMEAPLGTHCFNLCFSCNNRVMVIELNTQYILTDDTAAFLLVF